MEKDRLLAFSDGVIAIIITIMVLELHAPEEATLAALTALLGETRGALWPTVVYGANLLLAAIAYYILQSLIVRAHAPDHALKRAIGDDYKGNISPLLYVAALGAAFYDPRIAQALFVLVALIWLVPDRRIERVVAGK